MRAVELVLLPLIKLSVLLRDLTPDVCSCSDISSIRPKKKNRSKRCCCCWISCSLRIELAREHISRVERLGVAKPCDLLPIRLENGTLKEITAMHPFSVSRLIKLLQGTVSCNAIQCMSDSLQIQLEMEGEGRQWEGEIERYKIIFLYEFDITRERRACKSFLMSKQVPLIMHQQH